MKTSRPMKQFPLKDYPRLIELLTELAAFTTKWQTPKIGKSVDVSRQSIQYHINKKKENK